MPRIAEALLFKARSHQIDDIPDAEMTARFGPETARTPACRAIASRASTGSPRRWRPAAADRPREDRRWIR